MLYYRRRVTHGHHAITGERAPTLVPADMPPSDAAAASAAAAEAESLADGMDH